MISEIPQLDGGKNYRKKKKKEIEELKQNSYL